MTAWWGYHAGAALTLAVCLWLLAVLIVGAIMYAIWKE